MNIVEQQLAFMRQMGYIVNNKPGLTCETHSWERKIFSAQHSLQLASTQLHKTLSADALAEVLLHGVATIHATLGLLNNVGLSAQVIKALDMYQDSLLHDNPPPNFLREVLDQKRQTEE